MVLGVVQGLFGIAVLGACAVTIRDAFTRDPQLGVHLAMTGAFALVFFLAVPDAPTEIIAVSLLTVVCGVLIHPRVSRRIDLGDDSTIRRRLQ